MYLNNLLGYRILALVVGLARAQDSFVGQNEVLEPSIIIINYWIIINSHYNCIINL
jgi:hypothetical protein